MNYSVEVSGLDELIASLRQFKTELPQDIHDGLQQEAFPVYFALADYPPPPPGSDYMRTYLYRDSLNVDVIYDGADAQLIAEQKAPYSIYLRGDLQGYAGAWMHVGRWRSLQNIVDTLVPVVLDHLKRRVDMLTQRLFGA